MTDTGPGPDELRVRGILRDRGVGPDAHPGPPAVPPALPDGYEAASAKDPDAWWNDLYADEQAQPAGAARLPNWWSRKPGHLPTPPAPAADATTDEEPAVEADAEPEPEEAPAPRKRPRLTITRPRTSLSEATADISPKNRWLLLHCTAAAAGWPLGLITWGTNTAAWFAADHWTDSSAWVVYGLGVVALSLYRRTRHRGLLLAWAAAVPVSSVTCGVLLYGHAA